MLIAVADALWHLKGEGSQSSRSLAPLHNESKTENHITLGGLVRTTDPMD